VFEAAAAESVPALIVEKPLAIEAEDHAAMQAFASTTKIKIAVNHQLHFHPRRAWLQQRVGSGAIGEIRFVDASAGMNLAYQGTHSLEAIAYEDGARAQLQCGPGAPQVGREGIHTHKRIAVYGTRGFAHWWMWGWELGVDGRVETGSHEYPEEDVLGQARMTEAMFRWLEEDAAVHPLHLERSLEDFGVILGIYTSALRSEIVELPVTARPGLIAALRGRLDEA
jgi:hypothetical protein